MLDIKPPDRIKALLVHRHPIIDNIRLPAAILVDDDLVQTVFLKILSQEKRLVVRGWKKSYLSGKIRKLIVIFNPIKFMSFLREENRFVIFRILSVQIIEPSDDNFFPSYALQISFADFVFWITKNSFNEAAFLLIFMSIVNFPVRIVGRKVRPIDEFCFSLVVKLNVFLVLGKNVLAHFFSF